MAERPLPAELAALLGRVTDAEVAATLRDAAERWEACRRDPARCRRALGFLLEALADRAADPEAETVGCDAVSLVEVLQLVLLRPRGDGGPRG